MELRGLPRKKLREAIVNTFTVPEMNTFLIERMETNPAIISSAINDYNTYAGDVIRYFGHRNKNKELLLALSAERENEKAFTELLFELNYQPGIYNYDQPHDDLDVSGLQKLVNNNPDLNINTLYYGIGDNKRRVCRITVTNEDGNRLFGTGFLVGPDLLLTNYHVMEPVIKNPGLAGSVVCKFDYETDAGGNTIYPGIDFGLIVSQTVLASSPYCSLDVNGVNDVDAAWPADSLDYALVRLDKEVGNMPFGINAEMTSSDKAALRGWIKPQSVGSPLKKGGHIIIIHHPDKLPMKIGIGYSAITGADKNQRRVRYKLNTLGGSSGSPCFDEKFNWIALHNSGDPNYYPKFNQGIPAERIIEDLAAKHIHLI